VQIKVSAKLETANDFGGVLEGGCESFDLKRDLYVLRRKDRHLSEAAQAVLSVLAGPPG